MAVKKKAGKKTEGNFATDAQKKKFLEAYRISGNVSKSAQAAGFNRQYMYKLRITDPEFAMDWDEAKLELGDDIEGSLVSLAKDKNVTAQIFWLKNNRSETYGEKIKHQLEGHLVHNVRSLTDAELKRELKKLKKKVRG